MIKIRNLKINLYGKVRLAEVLEVLLLNSLSTIDSHFRLRISEKH